jgi:hypothetical protein
MPAPSVTVVPAVVASAVAPTVVEAAVSGAPPPAPSPPVVGARPLPPSVAAVAAVAAAAPFSSLPPTMKWNLVLDTLEARRKLSVFGNYQHARVLSFTDTAVELGFAADYTLGEMARTPEQIEVVKGVLRELSGTAINVAVRVLSASESATTPARSNLEESLARADDEKRRREAEAREHPMTRLVVETFGGSIKEIKTDV